MRKSLISALSPHALFTQPLLNCRPDPYPPPSPTHPTDYVRLYTWDKRLETLVKSTGILGGAGKMPTVVSPDVYMRRFREAIEVCVAVCVFVCVCVCMCVCVCVCVCVCGIEIAMIFLRAQRGQEKAPLCLSHAWAEEEAMLACRASAHGLRLRAFCAWTPPFPRRLLPFRPMPGEVHLCPCSHGSLTHAYECAHTPAL